VAGYDGLKGEKAAILFEMNLENEDVSRYLFGESKLSSGEGINVSCLTGESFHSKKVISDAKEIDSKKKKVSESMTSYAKFIGIAIIILLAFLAIRVPIIRSNIGILPGKYEIIASMALGIIGNAPIIVPTLADYLHRMYRVPGTISPADFIIGLPAIFLMTPFRILAKLITPSNPVLGFMIICALICFLGIIFGVKANKCLAEAEQMPDRGIGVIGLNVVSIIYFSTVILKLV
jgi:hypothetical protein